MFLSVGHAGKPGRRFIPAHEKIRFHCDHWRQGVANDDHAHAVLQGGAHGVPLLLAPSRVLTQRERSEQKQQG